MNVNFGLFPPVEVPREEGKRLRGKEKTIAKKRAMARRALADFSGWLAAEPSRCPSRRNSRASSAHARPFAVTQGNAGLHPQKLARRTPSQVRDTKPDSPAICRSQVDRERRKASGVRG